jgi:nitrite reductase/ring-hydroxylating ferredoxin subunit
MGLFSEKIKRYYVAESMGDLGAQVVANKELIRRFSFGSVLFVRDASIIRAVAAKCPHQGKSLKGCKIVADHVVCPWHQYRFALDTGRGHGLHLEVYPLIETPTGLYLERTYFGFW